MCVCVHIWLFQALACTRRRPSMAGDPQCGGKLANTSVVVRDGATDAPTDTEVTRTPLRQSSGRVGRSKPRTEPPGATHRRRLSGKLRAGGLRLSRSSRATVVASATFEVPSASLPGLSPYCRFCLFLFCYLSCDSRMNDPRSLSLPALAASRPRLRAVACRRKNKDDHDDDG